MSSARWGPGVGRTQAHVEQAGTGSPLLGMSRACWPPSLMAGCLLRKDPSPGRLCLKRGGPFHLKVRSLGTGSPSLCDAIGSPGATTLPLFSCQSSCQSPSCHVCIPVSQMRLWAPQGWRFCLQLPSMEAAGKLAGSSLPSGESICPLLPDHGQGQESSLQILWGWLGSGRGPMSQTISALQTAALVFQRETKSRAVGVKGVPGLILCQALVVWCCWSTLEREGACPKKQGWGALFTAETQAHPGVC